MIDMHYDLLIVLYRDILNNNFDTTKEWIKNYKIDNVSGLIANLCFETKEEMEKEYHPKYFQENVSVLEMFKLCVSKLKELMPQDINLMFGIEGCDYIDINELEEFYNYGLRSICVVWNEKNKYGSGVRYEGGLTPLGKEFICKAIDLGIGIDLSHTNEETFYDIIDIVRKYIDNGYSPVVYASHSNSKALCDRKRNLTDEQLEAIKSVRGYVGVMSNKNFVHLDSLDMPNDEIRKLYIEQIDYIAKTVGYDHVLLSTDDMKFCAMINPIYNKTSIYDYSTIKEDIENDLLTKYDKTTTDMILKGNAELIFSELTNQQSKSMTA